MSKMTFADYEQFLKTYLSPCRRDLVSGWLMTKIDGVWVPAINRLDVLASHALDAGLSQNGLKYHLARLESEMAPELLIDIPKWDGIDHLKALTSCLVCSLFDTDELAALITDWGSKVFSRLKNPKIQNRCLILLGRQGIGKDTWVSKLCGSLDHYFANISVTGNEREDNKQVMGLLVANISEFDRTERMRDSQIKDLITKEHIFDRELYSRAPAKRPARYSFIATANIPDILRDPTGNRRFIVIDIERINWSYDQIDSAQILAQLHHLSEVGFQTTVELEEKVSSINQSLTPEDPLQLAESFLTGNLLKRHRSSYSHEFTYADLADVVFDCARACGLSKKSIQQILRKKFLIRRLSDGPRYGLSELARLRFQVES